MEILIGMDEAGYGPNLGPLVVAATAWGVDGREVSGDGCRMSEEDGTLHPTSARRGSANGTAVLAPASSISQRKSKRNSVAKKTLFSDEIDLYRLLRPAVSRSASERQLAIADSKLLYKPGLGLRQLERGVHAVLLAMQRSHVCWSQLVDGCAADPHGHHRKLPWHDGFDCTVPVDATAVELSRISMRFVRACDKSAVRPLVIRARMIYPAEFNKLVEFYGSKGAALSHVTVGLLREVMDLLAINPPSAAPQQTRNTNLSPAAGPQPQLPTYIVCDKHGGRNFYLSLLQHHFSEHWITPVRESGYESRYEWGPEESRVRATFRVGGESFLPTALASMTAKYFRELAMRAWNEFWCARVKDLRPTAGYYVDSRRFKADIESAQRDLKIEDHTIWRER